MAIDRVQPPRTVDVSVVPPPSMAAKPEAEGAVAAAAAGREGAVAAVAAMRELEAAASCTVAWVVAWLVQAVWGLAWLLSGVQVVVFRAVSLATAVGAAVVPSVGDPFRRRSGTGGFAEALEIAAARQSANGHREAKLGASKVVPGSSQSAKAKRAATADCRTARRGRIAAGCGISIVEPSFELDGSRAGCTT